MIFTRLLSLLLFSTYPKKVIPSLIVATVICLSAIHIILVIAVVVGIVNAMFMQGLGQFFWPLHYWCVLGVQA